MLEDASNPVFVTDGKDLVLACNAAAGRLVGHGRERMVGRVLHEIVEIREAFRGRLRADSGTLDRMVLDGEPVPSLHFAVRDAKGELLPVAISASVVLGAQPAEKRLVYHLTPRPYRRRSDQAIARLLATDLAATSQGAADREGRGEAPRLTGREKRILDLLAEGRSTVEMCEALGISANTVRSHVRNLLRKLGAHSRAEAMSVALRLHLV